ncbi:MAG: sugar phosphate isomerase/epimerase family protein [Pirellulaceae bacterium]
MTKSICMTRRDFIRRVGALGAAGMFPLPAIGACQETLPPYLKDEGWQIGCWTRPWAKFDYRVAMDEIAEAGFRYMATTGAKTSTGRVIAPGTSLAEAERVGEEARQRGLTITNAYGGGIALHEGRDPLTKLIDNCAAAGARSVLIAHMGDKNTYDAHCLAIAESCEYAARHKIVIVLKPHGGMTGTGRQLRNALERVNHGHFTLMYDPGNIYYYSDGEIDPVQDVAHVAGLITGVSIKDYQHPRNVALSPGTGQVEFRELMVKLRNGGFHHGPLLVETLAPGDQADTRNEATKARKFVETLVRGI